MASLNTIRHYLTHDEAAVGRHLEDFVSVPAFIYRLQQDSYLAISKSILNPLGMDNLNTGFQTFLERMHPADCLKVFSIYAQEVPMILQHKEGDALPVLRGFDFRILDKNKRWRRGVVKLDVAGYDAQGRPDKLFGVFWLDDTPMKMLEDVYEKPVEEIYSHALTHRMHEVKMSVKKFYMKNELKSPDISPREKQVMHGLAKGYSTREIAQQMNISFHTVETHRKHLLLKFNARNTVQMMLKAAKVLSAQF